MITFSEIDVVTEKGIVQNKRYFGRISHGRPGKRQVTLIEREQIAEHAAVLGLKSIPPGIVRSNIETEGINLIDLIGHRVQIGTATLEFVEPRTPCSKMDDIAPGLRELMDDKRQGVIARVITSGTVRVGDEIRAGPLKTTAPARESS
jgi:MOSC domain-containing protein YiiM